MAHGGYDPLQEARDAAYAQQVYLSQAASLTGFPSSGLGSLGGGLLAQSQTLGVQTLANQANQYTAQQASQHLTSAGYAGNLTTGTGVATSTHPIGTTATQPVLQSGTSSNNLWYSVQPIPPPPGPPKEYFYSLLDRLEGPGEWPYDDLIMAMLDKRKFEIGKVSLLAFVSFCLVNRVVASEIAWNADMLEKLFGTFFEE